MATLGRVPSCCRDLHDPLGLGAGLQFNGHPGRYRLAKFGNALARVAKLMCCGGGSVVLSAVRKLQRGGDIEGIGQSAQGDGPPRASDSLLSRS